MFCCCCCCCLSFKISYNKLREAVQLWGCRLRTPGKIQELLSVYLGQEGHTTTSNDLPLRKRKGQRLGALSFLFFLSGSDIEIDIFPNSQTETFPQIWTAFPSPQQVRPLPAESYMVGMRKRRILGEDEGAGGWKLQTKAAPDPPCQAALNAMSLFPLNNVRTSTCTT